MSAISFELDKKNNISVKGSIFGTKKKALENEFAFQIQLLIKMYGKLKKLYIKALKNDGKIIGTERSDLIQAADKIINLVVLMFSFLDGERDFHVVSLDGIYPGFIFTLAIEGDSWNGGGKLSSVMLEQGKSMAEFFNNELNPAIMNFLEEYKEAAFDCKLTDFEKIALEKKLKHVLASSLSLRIQIAACLINS